MKWEDARDKWARQKVLTSGQHLQTDIEVVSIDIKDGGYYQIGEMTWDHDNPSIVIRYRTLGKRKRTLTYEEEIDFGRLVREIVRIAEGGKL